MKRFKNERFNLDKSHLKYTSNMYKHLPLYISLLFVITSCGGGGGGGSTPEPPTPGASITLSISDDQIYLGSSVTLTWTTSNASSCSASGSWSGTKALSGSETITPETDGQKSFTLTCSNSAGTSTNRTVSTNVIGNSQGVVVGANYISTSTVILDLNSNFLKPGPSMLTQMFLNFRG